MIRQGLEYLGRLLFVIVLVTSIYSKYLDQDNVLNFYQKNYEYIQVSLRSFGINLPRDQEADQVLSYFYFATIALETMIVLFLIWRKSLAGYFMILYYTAQAVIQYLIIRVGKGRASENIYFRWEMARFVALIGISLLFTYSQQKLRKPFQK